MGWFQNILQKFLDFLALFLILIIPSLYLVHLIISLIILSASLTSSWFCLVLMSLINTIFQNLVFINFYFKTQFCLCYAYFIFSFVLILNLNFCYYLIKLNLKTSIEMECQTLRRKIKMMMMKKILWYNLKKVIQINYFR